MDKLTEEVIKRAFVKTREENPIQDGILTLIHKEHHGKVLQFLREEFIPSEYISNVTGWRWNPVLESLYITALDLNISLMLLDKTNGDIMGVRLMEISKAGVEFSEDKFEDPGMKRSIGFWTLDDSRARFYERYDTNEAVHFFGLGVSSKYRNRGFGTLLVDLSLKFLKNLEMSPICVKAEGSSLFSIKIFEKLGFELLAEVKYDEYRKDGKIVIKSTGDNTGMRIYGMVI